MGCFDSLYVDCPHCTAGIEFQSKSGGCMMDRYTKDTLPVNVAIGMQGDIEKCEKCGKAVELNCGLRITAVVTLKIL